MRTEKRELMEQFLKDVDAQIAYEPMHAPINEELQAHIEDKAEMYMEFGVEEKLAYEKAIRDMGEPDVLSMQMNETHHLRIAKPLLCLIGALTQLGRLTALAAALTLFIQNLFYFAGNFGFQFGMFGNLPFVSEGWVSITGTMLLAGLVLSAYRFDTVVKESGD